MYIIIKIEEKKRYTYMYNCIWNEPIFVYKKKNSHKIRNETVKN